MCVRSTDPVSEIGYTVEVVPWLTELRHSPTANDILVDPLFWPASHSLHFLCDASDRFEILEKDHFVLEALEAEAPGIVGNDWLKNLDRNLIDNLGKYRKYDGGSVRDLLRVMRNKVSLGSALPRCYIPQHC